MKKLRAQRTPEEEDLIDLARKYFDRDELSELEDRAKQRFMRNVLEPKLEALFQREAKREDSE